VKVQVRVHFYPKFNRLAILGITTVDGRPLCEVGCDCGKRRKVLLSNLRSHHTKSCGCLRRDKARVQINLNRPAVSATLTHGGTSNPKLIPLYRVYRRMLARCYNPNATGFKNWGGRNIKVCSRWRGPNGFSRWLKFMGPRPQGFWMDRKNNDANYFPANVRWAHPKVQRMNQRRMKEAA
jgi:hypothetical protein